MKIYNVCFYRNFKCSKILISIYIKARSQHHAFSVALRTSGSIKDSITVTKISSLKDVLTLSKIYYRNYQNQLNKYFVCNKEKI